jgi:hypothetical protein
MYINIGDTDTVVSGLHQVDALFAKHAIVVLSQPDRGRGHAMRQPPTQIPLDAFVPLNSYIVLEELIHELEIGLPPIHPTPGSD